MSNRINVNEITWKNKPYIINEIEGTDAYYLSDNNGFILEKSQMQDLIRGLQFTMSEYE